MKYSVIIPVYKAQDTLERCLDSLLIQNYADAEIILVNDGSPDDSEKICKEYAESYPQVKYIAKKNGGVSSARNAGLDVAEGMYVTFVDSDDYVSDDYFLKIDEALLEFDWDYVLFSKRWNDGVNITEKIYPSYSERNRKDTAIKVADEIFKTTINGPVAKIYKRKIIQDKAIRFNEKLSISEDWTFNINYAVNISSICRVASALYYVSTENMDSLSRRIISDYREQHTKSMTDVRCAFDFCPLSEQEKEPIITMINFCDYRSVYTYAKIQHRQGLRLCRRLKNLRELCKSIHLRKLKIPSIRYCRLIALPVRLNFALMIDVVAWKLTH